MNNPEPQTAILRCTNLSKHYDEAGATVNVFNNLNLTVNSGEMIGILGVSGAGKSTLLHMLGGLDRPNEGDVWLAEHQMSKLKERKKSALRNEYLGFVYQFHHLLPEFNALENVCMPLWIKGFSNKSAKQKAAEIIDKVGLSQRMHHRISELSGGEKQRIAIARALVAEPKCILADEPTGNLDTETAAQVFDLMLQLNKTLNTSLVIVTHNKTLVTQMDRVLLLKDGSLVDVTTGGGV